MAIPANVRSKLSEFVNIGLAKGQALLITKVQSEIQSKLEQLLTECPPPEVLVPISTFIENVRPIITKTEQDVRQATQITEKLQPAITAGELLIEILTTNPLPQVIINGIPSPVSVIPFTPATVVQSTKGKVNSDSAVLQWARNLIEVLNDEGTAISAGVEAALQVLNPIKNQLDQLDAIVQACFQNQDLTDEERKRLLESIQGPKDQDPTLGGLEYTSQSGRTYTIKIKEDPNSGAIAPRRQAIVQDFRGITVLTGPASFATRTQILIDEIKFRIDNQLP